MFLYFSLIISTIYSVPARARLGARCFAYMLSHSLFSRKVFHLYWKAEYLLIPRNWQSGFKLRSVYLNLRALLFLPHYEANGYLFLLFTPPTPPNCINSSIVSRQWLQNSSLLTKLSSLKSLGHQPLIVHLYVPSHKVLSLWSLISHGFALGQMTSEVIKQIRWQIRGQGYHPASSLHQSGNKPCFLLTTEGYYPIGKLGWEPIESLHHLQQQCLWMTGLYNHLSPTI